MITIEELKAEWDADADDEFQWGAIGLDKLVAAVQEIEIEACAKICDAYDDRWTNLSAYLIRERLNKVSTGEKS